MTAQLDLWGGVHPPVKPRRESAPYVPQSVTSKSAAESILDTMSATERRIWNHIRVWGGCTCDEVEQHLKFQTLHLNQVVQMLVKFILILHLV